MFLSLDQVNILLSGVPGAGKSATLNLIIAWAALDLWCHLYLIDGKSELGRWSSVATARVESVEEACELLARVEAERKHRQFERGGRGVLAWRPGEVPLILVCVDELALYTDMTGLSGAEKSARQEFCGLLVQLARLGRADRVCLVCSTQRPSLDTVPGSYRELVSVRLALRCSTRDQSEIALGAGAFASGLDATTLPPTPGSLIVRGHQATAQRGRAYWLSDEDCRTVLRAATAARHLPGMASQGPAETL
jgi:S-DNA-T family DNA segregation ATPase FtsK/SpoIIIE